MLVILLWAVDWFNREDNAGSDVEHVYFGSKKKVIIIPITITKKREKKQNWEKTCS